MINLKRKWIAVAMAAVISGGVLGSNVAIATEGNQPPAPAGPLRRAYWRALGVRTSRLRMRVTDAITQRGIPGAGCVIGESGDRIETDAAGLGPVIDAPVFRNPRLEQMLAELHGALTIMCYKNGYRDAVTMGVRTYEGVLNEPEIWMYPVGTGDRRVEPTLYQVPVHRLWRIELADKYRLREEGEGPERPELTRPDMGVAAPQQPMGTEPQTPIYPAPPQVNIGGAQARPQAAPGPAAQP